MLAIARLTGLSCLTLRPANHHLAYEQRLPDSSLRQTFIWIGVAALAFCVDTVMLMQLEILSHRDHGLTGHPGSVVVASLGNRLPGLHQDKQGL